MAAILGDLTRKYQNKSILINADIVSIISQIQLTSDLISVRNAVPLTIVLNDLNRKAGDYTQLGIRDYLSLITQIQKNTDAINILSGLPQVTVLGAIFRNCIDNIEPTINDFLFIIDQVQSNRDAILNLPSTYILQVIQGNFNLSTVNVQLFKSNPAAMPVTTATINVTANSINLVYTPPTLQVLWDNIAALADYGHGPVTTNAQGGFFKETTLVNQCANKDVCLGIRSLGNNKPNLHNLLFNGDQSITPTNGLLFFKDEAVNPQFIDRGNFDKYIRFFNGPPNVGYYETNPGSISPNITHPIDFFMGLRYNPHTPDEGVNRIKPLGSTTALEHLTVFDGYSPDIILANGTSLPYYIDSLLHVKVNSDNTWQVWINGVSKGTGTGVSFTTNEWIWGTNSHAMQSHIRFMIVKFGAGGFSAGDVTTIETNSQAIWPWQKPSYPFITELYYGDSSTFDSATKSWQAGRGKIRVFSGGNGIEGTHQYMWYYWRASDPLYTASDGVLTNHGQVPASVNISTIAGGNSVTQISMDGFNLMSAPVSFVTSASATADAVVTNVNANQTKYLAQRTSTATILLHPRGLGCNNYSLNAVTITVSGFTATKIDAPRGQTLVRTTYAAPGQIWDGIQGNNTTVVACITIPFDSAGTPGEMIPSRWIPDNIV